MKPPAPYCRSSNDRIPCKHCKYKKSYNDNDSDDSFAATSSSHDCNNSLDILWSVPVSDILSCQATNRPDCKCVNDDNCAESYENHGDCTVAANCTTMMIMLILGMHDNHRKE
jgi:hypothetical protein